MLIKEGHKKIHNHKKIVKKLLEHRLDFSVPKPIVTHVRRPQKQNMNRYNAETLSKVSVLVDDYKNTKLHYSAATGDEAQVLKDLETKPVVDAENYLGWTPLMMACRNGHLNIVRILLGRANVTKKNRFGMSVFLISISSKNKSLVYLILQHLLCGGVSRQSMARVISPLAMATMFFDRDVLYYLTHKHNFNVNAGTPITGLTPIMFAAALDNFEVVALFCCMGADMTLKNCNDFDAQMIHRYRVPRMLEVEPDSYIL